MGAKAYSIAGTLYAGLLDSNKALAEGYLDLGNIFPFNLKVETEQKSQTSAMKETAGQLLDVINRLKTNGISGAMTMHQWQARTLAWAVMGDAIAMTGASGSVDVGTPEDVVAIHDQYVRLDHKDVSSLVIKDDTDTTTYVAGTDYELIAKVGLVKVLSTGSIGDGDTLHASYSYAAESGYQVSIAANTILRAAMILDGKNLNDGTEFNGEFYSVVMASNTAINLISDPSTDYEKLDFSLIFETPSGKTTPGVINGIPL